MGKGVLDFSRTVGRLKKVNRKGWVTGVGIENPESVADHTFLTTVLTMCFCDLKGLDTERFMKMALLHDVHEALLGDYDRKDREKLDKHELRDRESEAITRVFSTLPEELQAEYSSIALEFQRQVTREARLLKQIDQLEMIVQALEYEQDGYDRVKLQAFWDSVEETLDDAELVMLFELLLAERMG